MNENKETVSPNEESLSPASATPDIYVPFLKVPYIFLQLVTAGVFDIYEVLFLSLLKSYRDGGIEVYMSNESIAEKLGIGRTKTKTIIDQLSKREFIYKDKISYGKRQIGLSSNFDQLIAEKFSTISVATRPIIGRHTTHFSTFQQEEIGRHTTYNSEPEIIIGRHTTDYRSPHDLLSVVPRPIIGRHTTDYRSPHDLNNIYIDNPNNSSNISPKNGDGEPDGSPLAGLRPDPPTDSAINNSPIPDSESSEENQVKGTIPPSSESYEQTFPETTLSYAERIYPHDGPQYSLPDYQRKFLYLINIPIPDNYLYMDANQRADYLWRYFSKETKESFGNSLVSFQFDYWENAKALLRVCGDIESGNGWLYGFG